MNASLAVKEDELRRIRADADIEERLDDNPLQDVLLSLVDLLETESEESQSSKRDKRAFSLVVANTTSTVSTPSSTVDNSPSILPSTPPYSQPRFPLSFDEVSNKRKISQTSFGTRSTETTPNKLQQPEAKVQSLRNTFVKRIINKLWFGKISIPWARNRYMFLTYNSYIHHYDLYSQLGRTTCPFSTVY